jgi:hypothetical protein
MLFHRARKSRILKPKYLRDAAPVGEAQTQPAIMERTHKEFAGGKLNRSQLSAGGLAVHNFIFE